MVNASIKAVLVVWDLFLRYINNNVQIDEVLGSVTKNTFEKMRKLADELKDSQPNSVV
ncbi:hypothetical protein [Helicobacter cetorum]|uniref:hypothetical protein n=1 Tax=Helicobacter cetorum TaxID=138563 RepID=UPI0002E431A9|nr:hypothetical protein [Helicobacter cetorum]